MASILAMVLAGGKERGYWRDVGSLSSYYKANMDLVGVQPTFNLYNAEWPILTWQFPLPPAKFVHEDGTRQGTALNSLVASGVIVSGGTVKRSILSRNVRIHSYARIEDSVLFDNVVVGRGAIVRRAIIDKNVSIPEGFQVGVDLDEDRRRFTVTDEASWLSAGNRPRRTQFVCELERAPPGRGKRLATVHTSHEVPIRTGPVVGPSRSSQGLLVPIGSSCRIE